MYRFALEAALKHRKNREETLRKGVADIEAELSAARVKRRELFEARTRAGADLENRQRIGVMLSEALTYKQYLERLSGEAFRNEQQIAEMEVRLRGERDELIEAVKKRKILECLRDKGLRAYKEKVLKAEDSLLSEVAVTLYNRRA